MSGERRRSELGSRLERRLMCARMQAHTMQRGDHTGRE